MCSIACKHGKPPETDLIVYRKCGIAFGMQFMMLHSPISLTVFMSSFSSSRFAYVCTSRVISLLHHWTCRWTFKHVSQSLCKNLFCCCSFFVSRVCESETIERLTLTLAVVFIDCGINLTATLWPHQFSFKFICCLFISSIQLAIKHIYIHMYSVFVRWHSLSFSP